MAKLEENQEERVEELFITLRIHKRMGFFC